MDDLKGISFLYYGEIGFFGVLESEVGTHGVARVLVTNGTTREQWVFNMNDAHQVGMTLFLSKAPRRTEYRKGEWNEQ